MNLVANEWLPELDVVASIPPGLVGSFERGASLTEPGPGFG